MSRFLVAALFFFVDGPARADDAAMGRRLQETLAEHGADVHGCYGIALADSPGLTGELLFRMHVTPGGTVERVEVLSDHAGSPRLATCLTDAMRRWQVPKLAGEATQQVVFPLAFKPDEQKFVVPLSDGKPGPLPGGKLEARVLIDPVTVGPTQATLTKLNLPPSARLALHTHPGALEILYVVKGRAHLRDATGIPDSAASVGDAMLIDAAVPHNVEAAPLAPLELLQFFVPGGPEKAYRDPTAREGTVAAKKQTGQPKPSILHAAEAKAWSILGGKGSAQLLLDGKTEKASLQRFEAVAGAVVPQHQHDVSDEILFILAGTAEMTVGATRYVVGPSDAIRIPKATQHSLHVVEKLSAVQLYAPAGPEQRFKVHPK